jgi:hypothetical protein
LDTAGVENRKEKYKPTHRHSRACTVSSKKKLGNMNLKKRVRGSPSPIPSLFLLFPNKIIPPKPAIVIRHSLRIKEIKNHGKTTYLFYRHASGSRTSTSINSGTIIYTRQKHEKTTPTTTTTTETNHRSGSWPIGFGLFPGIATTWIRSFDCRSEITSRRTLERGGARTWS